MLCFRKPRGLAWRWLAIFLVSWFVSGLATEARADGKVFPAARLPQEVTMPDQRALLAWKDGTETLVIESAFVGQGTDFAWVVPFPTKPEVFAATPGTLPAAVALMQPVIAESTKGSWGLWLALGLVGLGAVTFGWGTVGKCTRLLVLIFGMGIMAAIAGALTESGAITMGVWALGCLALWPLRTWIQRETRMVEVLVVLLIFVLLAAMATPNFSKVRGRADPVFAEEPTVAVERHVVGDFDVAVLSGGEGGGVVAWLDANGFALDAAARRVAEEHAAAGGWFAASRIRREFAGGGRSVPAPLAFRFATKQPVYPMRLTGAGATRSLELELLIFGPGQATMEGLAAKSVAPLHHGEPEEQTRRTRPFQPGDSRHISHPELERWTAGSMAATWLRGTLSPQQMQGDLTVGWHADRAPLGLYAYTSEDAWHNAAQVGAVLIFLGAVGLGLAFGNGRLPTRWSAVVSLAALAVAGLIRAGTPTVATTRMHEGLPLYMQQNLAQLTVVALLELPTGSPDEIVRQAFRREMEKRSVQLERSILIGDSPGEIDLVKLPGGTWRVLFHDAYGQPRYFKGWDFKPEGPHPVPSSSHASGADSA